MINPVPNPIYLRLPFAYEARHLDLSLLRNEQNNNLNFVAGRLCAVQALMSMGASDFQNLPAGEDGGPCWPKGYVGSISHCDEHAIALVTRLTEVSTVGVDIESILLPSHSKEIEDLILVEEELNWLPKDPIERALKVTTIFSAKESIFKAIAYLSGKKLDFSDASVTQMEEPTGKFLALLKSGDKLEGLVSYIFKKQVATIVWKSN